MAPVRSHSDQMSNDSEDGWLADGLRGSIFYKAPDTNEEAIYSVLGSHPRIVKYLGSNPLTGRIMLSALRNGSLLFHLEAHSGIPLSTRLTWAVEIAQGVAHLHAHDVIWADPHFNNILLTDDYHAVLCDFGLSVRSAPYFYNFTTGPPPTFMCPFGYCAKTPRRIDIFGLGVIIFALLSERFPFHKDIFPSVQEEAEIFQKHHEITNDKLPSSLDSYFGNIVAKCFTIEYQAADSLATELEDAFDLWLKDNEQKLGSPDSASLDIPYPRRPVPSRLPVGRVEHQYTLPPFDPSIYKLPEGDEW